MLLYQYNEVEIIDILNRIYDRTKRDTEFIVKQLQDYPLNKTYVYYQNILKTEFQQIVSLNKQYSMIAVGKYQDLYCDNVTDLKEEMKLLALSLIINNDAVKASQYKNSLPINYQKIVERIYDNKQRLAKNDLPVYNEFLQQILLLGQSQESLEQYLLCAYDFVVAEIVEIANSLVEQSLCQQAIPLYQYVLANPNGFDKNIILTKLGYCYYKQEVYKEAIKYFDQVIKNGGTDKELIQLNQWSKEKMNMNLNITEPNTNEIITNTSNDKNLTSIVILTYNQLEYTKLCIESIRNYTEKGTYEIIVVDNHSTDDTVSWLKKQKDIKTIFNQENKGFPAGCNQGIEIASGSEILLLNNDTIVTKNWLTNLKTALYSDEKVGAVGAVTNSCSNYQAITVSYTDADGLHKFAQQYNVSNPDKWERRINLVGFCMLIKRSVIDLIGVLDEQFTPGNYEDDDYSFRINSAGYYLLLCNDTFIHHFGSASFRENPENYNNLLRKNQLKFKEKWGFDARYSTFCRHEIIEFMEINKPNIKVLEVGCACGATLLRIKYLNKTAEIHGIELCPEPAAIAKHFAHVTAENIENTHIAYQEGFFDYIIFADVLEHLYQPQQVLENMKKYLKPDGYILASIPNVMHVSVVKDLLKGNWTYQDAGILDKTHIRFFTFREIDKMFIQAGYTNMQYGSVNMGGSKEDEEFIEQLGTLGVVEDKNAFKIYQYLVKAQNERLQENNQEVTITSNNSDNSPQGMQNLKFVLRRIENDIDETENLEIIVQAVSEQRFAISEIVETIKTAIYQKAKVVILVSTALYQQGKTKETLKLLVEIYKVYPTDAEIVYALGFILNLLQDKDTALRVLSSFQGENENIKALMQEIRGEN
jgi:GT2 family glycosyltransferase